MRESQNKRMGGGTILPIDTGLVNIYGSRNDLVQALIDLKVNAVRDEFKRLAIEGDAWSSRSPTSRRRS